MPAPPAEQLYLKSSSNASTLPLLSNLNPAYSLFSLRSVMNSQLPLSGPRFPCSHSQPLDGQCDDGLPLPERLRGFLLHDCKATQAPGAWPTHPCSLTSPHSRRLPLLWTCQLSLRSASALHTAFLTPHSQRLLGRHLQGWRRPPPPLPGPPGPGGSAVSHSASLTHLGSRSPCLSLARTDPCCRSASKFTTNPRCWAVSNSEWLHQFLALCPASKSANMTLVAKRIKLFKNTEHLRTIKKYP